MTSNPILVRSLFRALIRATNLFGGASNDKAVVLNCLLHRTGFGDVYWGSSATQSYETDFDSDDEAEISTGSNSGFIGIINDDEKTKSVLLFRKLLREIISGEKDGIRLMQFPRHVVSTLEKTNRFRRIVCREFKDQPGSLSHQFDNKIRSTVAFLALREINKKLAWMDQLEDNVSKKQWHPNQAARDIHPLPLRPSSEYLRPGVFLIAHPSMTGYFRRAVIFILHHSKECEQFEEYDDEDDRISQQSIVKTKELKGTYGVIVNRVCASKAGKSLTLEEAIRPIPPKVSEAFGSILVKEGGPVHMSLQVIRSSPKETDIHGIGGTIIKTIQSNESPGSNKTVHFNFDILKASQAVVSGKFDRNDVSFFLGASTWSPGQLESEIERGCWLPCVGNLDIARSGICDHDPINIMNENNNINTNIFNNGNFRPRADLWLSMLSACGKHEEQLAKLFVDAEENHDYGRACDHF